MEYLNEFENLVTTSQETMIGLGNPNAKVLIIACEPSIPESNNDQIEREIRQNKNQWLSILKYPEKMDEWLSSYNPNVNPCIDLECHYPNYNPFFPYYGHCGQKNTRSKIDGTSCSWWNYQKIMEGILGSPKQPIINFFQNCFVTDLSAENAVNQNQTIKSKTQLSIDNRISGLFSHTFFQKFPIILMCCGHYVRNFGVKPYELFNVPFLEEKQDKNGEWINYHCVNGNTPRLLLHTKHLTARCLKVNDYIAEIVKLCRHFVDENNIQF